ncbi:MAG: ATP-binding protein, partial [Methanosarcinaceae archaeon]|nr:ATP-binding protein [Methanosarcinaceae archaeon]
EIQHADEWDLWLKTIYDQKENIKIIASGSAAVQLKKQSESLYGRSIEFTIHPFSFFEFALYMQKDEDKLSQLRNKINFDELDFDINAAELVELENEMTLLLNKYLVRGGFPEIFNISDLTKSFYVLRDDIMNKAIYHDIVTLFKIKDPQVVESLIIYLAGNSSEILNKDGLSEDLGIPKSTIHTYLDYLRKSFLARNSRNYSRSVKKMLRTREKWYVPDAGIMNMLNYRNETLLSDGTYLGHLTETVVFNHILTLAEMQNYNIAYWRDKSKSEVDIVLDMHKRVVPIEVKYQSKITKQDVKGLLKFMDKFDVDKGILVTRNVFKKEIYDGKEIIFVPMWVLLVSM